MRWEKVSPTSHPNLIQALWCNPGCRGKCLQNGTSRNVAQCPETTKRLCNYFQTNDVVGDLWNLSELMVFIAYHSCCDHNIRHKWGDQYNKPWASIQVWVWNSFYKRWKIQREQVLVFCSDMQAMQFKTWNTSCGQHTVMPSPVQIAKLKSSIKGCVKIMVPFRLDGLW